MKKSLKKALSVLLAVTMVFGTVAFGIAEVDWSELAFVAKAEQKLSYPTEQKFWVVFREGYRNNRVEMSTFDSDLSEEELYLVWDRSVKLNNTSGSSEISQFCIQDDQWSQIGTYGIPTDYAYQIIATNLDVYDGEGNLVMEKTTYENGKELILKELDSIDNDYVKHSFNGHEYAVFDIAMTWNEAKVYCEKLGGHLATVTSQDEQDFINKNLVEKTSTKRQFWLGSYFSDSNTWKWITGEKWEYVNWAPGEPTGGQNYLTVLGTYYSDCGMWLDNPNNGTGSPWTLAETGFICEWDNYRNGIETFEYDGHYYSIMDIGLTWNEAKEYCESIGGYLATITTAEEQTFVESILDKGNRNCYWLGAERVNGDFSWITGEAFSYTNWKSKEPNNQRGQEHYLEIYAQTYDSIKVGQWNDIMADARNGEKDKSFYSLDSIGIICEWDYYNNVKYEGKVKVNKMDDSFTITTKQSDYNEKWFELKGVTAHIGETEISTKDSTLKITRDVLYENGSSDVVLKKEGFRDYIIPFKVANSMCDGDNLDIYMVLDTKDDKPYISSVFARNSAASEYKDLFKNSMVAEIDNEYDIIVSSVGFGSDETYFIAQDTSHVISNGTEYFSSVDLYSKLTLNKPVYVYAADKTGKMTDLEKISLSKSTDDGSLTKMLNMSTYSLGGAGGITIKIPDENPIFGNSEISLEAFKAPITLYYDATNDTYIGTVGWDLYSYTQKDKTVSNASGSLTKFGNGETKNAIQNFKESFEKFDAKKTKEEWNSFVNRCRTASKYKQKYYNKNFTVDFLGYIEFAITEQGFTVKEAKLKVGTEFTYSYTYQGAVWVIPAYFKASLGASAALEGSGKRMMADRGIPFEYEITLDVEPKLALEAGIGVEKLAKAGVEAKGTAPIKTEFFKQHFTLDFHGEINIKTKAFVFSWEKNLIEGEVNVVDWYWGSSSKSLMSTASGVPQYTVSSNEDGTAKLIEYYNESSSVSERDYLENMSSWYGEVSTCSRDSVVSDISVKELQTSVLEDGKPAMITVKDKVLMAWIEDCAERDTYNRMRLVYSVYDGTTWSEPIAVYDDGKNDDAPVLATDGTNVYFVWQKINEVLDENSAVTDALQQVDICTATYSSISNRVIDAKVICTDNGYDYAQEITVEGGKPVIYFASCTDPSVAVSFNNKINKWSDGNVEELVDSLSFVQSISADESDMSYVLDTDGDLATSNDINVFEYSEGYSTAYDKKDITNAIVGSYYGKMNGKKIMFVTDGTNIYYDTDGERNFVFANGQNLSSLNLIEQDGNPAFMWTEDNGNGNNICYIYYDGTEWTEPVVIYQSEGYYFDSLDIVNYNNNLVGAFMQDMISYDAETETDEISQVNLAYITITDYSNIGVGCITVDEETLAPGAISQICTYVENKGTEHINSAIFTLSDSLSEAQTIIYNVDLAPGESKNVYIDYLVPNGFKQTTLTVTAEIDDDNDLTDNYSETTIGIPDLKFVKCNYVVDGDYYIVTANVRNESITPAEDIIAKLFVNDKEGNLYHEVKIESLASDEMGIAQFYVDRDSLDFDESNTARLFCWFEDEDSKFGKTSTECLLITESVKNCGHPVTENRGKVYPTRTEEGIETGEYCLACDKYISGGETIPMLDADTYVADFVVDGVVTRKTFKTGERVIALDNPMKEGYSFVGWTPEIPDVMPAEDLTFIAVFEKIEPDIPEGSTVQPTEPNTESTTELTEPSTNPEEPTVKPTEPTTKPVVTAPALFVEIRKPSQTEIKYGDSIILHTDTKNLPEGAYINWSVDNGNFTIVSYSADRSSCTVTPSANGDSFITVTVYDADGNEIGSDSQIMSSKAGFFQKIIAFFKKLFGLTKVIPETFKGIF